LLVYSSKILEKRAKQVLPGSKRVGVKRRGQGEEMGQTIYAHMNK
jgi:hypothetical protein